MASTKLKVVKIDRHTQTFGQGVQEYAVYNCETPNKEIIPVGVSHNMLSTAGVGSALFGSVVGSTLIIKDDVDRATGLLREEGTERVQAVVEKRPKRTILLVNALNSELIQSEALRDECVDYSIRVDSIVKVEKERQRKLDRARRRAQALEEDLATSATPDTSAQEAEPTGMFDEAEVAESTAEVSALLEDNEENP